MTDHLFNLHGDVLAAMRRGPKGFAKLAFVLSESEGKPTSTSAISGTGSSRHGRGTSSSRCGTAL